MKQFEDALETWDSLLEMNASELNTTLVKMNTEYSLMILMKANTGCNNQMIFLLLLKMLQTYGET